MRILISDLDVIRGYMIRFNRRLKRYPNNEIKTIWSIIEQAIDISERRVNYMSISNINSLIYKTKKQTMNLAKKYNDEKLKKSWELMKYKAEWWLDIALDHNIN